MRDLIDRINQIIFQSTLSVRRAASGHRAVQRHLRFQSTLSVRRAARSAPSSRDPLPISIHALREESGRTPHPGSMEIDEFQSTLSVRRAAATVRRPDRIVDRTFTDNHILPLMLPNNH